jgi:hypothetical protein
VKQEKEKKEKKRNAGVRREEPMRTADTRTPLPPRYTKYILLVLQREAPKSRYCGEKHAQFLPARDQGCLNSGSRMWQLPRSQAIKLYLLDVVLPRKYLRNINLSPVLGSSGCY